MIVYAISTQSSRLHDGLDRLYRFSAPSDLHTFTPGAVQQFPRFIGQKLLASVPFISNTENIAAASILFCLFRLTEPVQIFHHKRTVYGDALQRQASIHLPAVGTGIQSLFPDAVMYGAELVAEGRFYALYAAACAVYHFRCDRYPVELCPQRSGFLAQSVVICYCCDSGVAFFAIQSAAADQLVCVFHSCLHKLSFF